MNNHNPSASSHPTPQGGAKQQSLNREVLRLALPAIVSNVTVPLLSLSDTAISGHLSGQDGGGAAIGAIAVGGMMLNVAYWLFGFLRMGTTGLAAEAYGADDLRHRQMVLWRSLVLALAVGVMLVAVSRPLSLLLLHVVGADRSVADMARSYYHLCICGSPALLCTMAVNGWMVGMQNTRYPMAVAIITNIINIGLSLWFVFGAGMGFTGVAWGTLTAQWCGLVLSFAMASRLGATFAPLWRKETRRQEWRDLLKGDGLRRYFTVNVNLFFRSACIMAVSMAVTSVGARIGTLTLASNAVMMQFFIFFSYFTDGFAFAAEALTGKCKGAGDHDGLKRTVKVILRWGVGMAMLFFAIYAVGNGLITDLITDDEAVREEVKRCAVIVCLIPPLSVWAFLFDGIYIGLTDTRKLLWAAALAALLFFGVVLIPCSGWIEPNIQLWIAFLGYLVIRALVLWHLLPGILTVQNQRTES